MINVNDIVDIHHGNILNVVISLPAILYYILEKENMLIFYAEYISALHLFVLARAQHFGFV